MPRKKARVYTEEEIELRKRNLKLMDYHVRKAYEALERVREFGGDVDFTYTEESRGGWGCQVFHYHNCKDTLAEIVHEIADALKFNGVEPESTEKYVSNPVRD